MFESMPDEAAATTAPVQCAQPPGAPRRILIVDNNVSTRRFLSAVLSAEGGCECGIAKDAEEALVLVAAAAAKGLAFELILCDLMLPGMDGCALIARLRRDRLRAPILILSSQQTEESLAAALSAGADDYLQKPVDLAELRRAMASLLSRAAERGSGRRQNAPMTGGTVAIKTLDGATYIELTAPTNSAQIDSFQRFAERLVTPMMAHHDRVNVRLALEEMIQNAREWGNGFDDLKMVRLAYCVLPDRVVFRIEDEGTGFEPYSVPDPSIDPKAHVRARMSSGKRVGGWGLFMTRKLMDEVAFNGNGNVVFITKLLKNVLPVNADATPLDVDDTAAGMTEGGAFRPLLEQVEKTKTKTRRFINGELQWTK